MRGQRWTTEREEGINRAKRGAWWVRDQKEQGKGIKAKQEGSGSWMWTRRGQKIGQGIRTVRPGCVRTPRQGPEKGRGPAGLGEARAPGA